MTDFERYAPAIVLLNMGLGVMAAGFSAEVLHNGTPITPETYGEVVYTIPALVWSGAQFLAAFCAALGAFIMGRAGAWITVVADSALACLCFLFGFMAQEAAFGSPIVWGSFAVSGPLATASAIVALRHLRLSQ